MLVPKRNDVLEVTKTPKRGKAYLYHATVREVAPFLAGFLVEVRPTDRREGRYRNFVIDDSGIHSYDKITGFNFVQFAPNPNPQINNPEFVLV